ncbi:hypothetical protein MKX03_019318 [Papaver bracteatum]|nr:hypothetical protein MKX03_019318 [Papaver bracteatum]
MGFPHILIVFCFLSIVQVSEHSKTQPETPPPLSDSCNGVLLSYTSTLGKKLKPPSENLAKQACKFNSTAKIVNNGLEDLKAWKMYVGFKRAEFLVSASNAVLADGTPLPINTSSEDSGPVVFAGFPNADLKTEIETAGDLRQTEAEINIVGTVFGVQPPAVPMPINIALWNDGFICGHPKMQDPDYLSNVISERFLPREEGDIEIMYDILRSYDSEYVAQVSVSNYNPLGRLDYWKLSWMRKRQEFITTMKGAYPSIVDSRDCLFGPQGVYYKDMDFNNVLNCQKNPTIVDLPLEKTNDSTLGGMLFCCKNGTILPPSMGPSRSTSIFQLTVKKMPPHLSRTDLVAPQDFQINGKFIPDIKCGLPKLVSPSSFPDISGLPINKIAVKSWQVVCKVIQPKDVSPKCCVSFSAFYNESAIPCKTCACGCPASSNTCNTTAPARLLPPDALLVPFDNRTLMGKDWAEIKHLQISEPAPCPDNCGVSINWHINSDNAEDWSARMSVLNWGERNFADWFAAVQFRKAVPDIQKMHSFNCTALDDSNNTIFVHGLEGFNCLAAEEDGAESEWDLRVPGKQQSVIEFSKTRTPGFNIVQGDGFPSKIFFNGMECSLPSVLPTSRAPSIRSFRIWAILGAVAVILF